MKRVTVFLAVLLVAALCGAGLAEIVGETVLREGKYVVNRDIPAGKYRLTCTGTDGEQLGTAYGSLGAALDGLGGESGYADLFGALGGMMGAFSEMTVEILGDFGDVLGSRDMKTGDSILIVLKEGTALKITGGSCTLVAAK